MGQQKEKRKSKEREKISSQKVVSKEKKSPKIAKCSVEIRNKHINILSLSIFQN